MYGGVGGVVLVLRTICSGFERLRVGAMYNNAFGSKYLLVLAYCATVVFVLVSQDSASRHTDLGTGHCPVPTYDSQ